MQINWYYRLSIIGSNTLNLILILIFQDAGSQQIGFLLGSCGIQVALTSEACLKGLPKTATGEVVGFKGWPKLHWFVTEHLTKVPKDWSPTPRLTDDTAAYIEVCYSWSHIYSHLIDFLTILNLISSWFDVFEAHYSRRHGDLLLTLTYAY